MTKLMILPLLIASLLGCRDNSGVASMDQTAEVENKREASSDSLRASIIDPDSKDGIDDGQASTQVGMPGGASIGAPDGSLLSAKNFGKPEESILPDAGRKMRPNVDFENMLQGFLRCRYDGMWVPGDYGVRSEFPENPYFKKHNAKGCGADEEFSRYCVEEVFHGLDVTQIAVPIQGGIPRVSIFVRQDLRLARKILRAEVGSEFRESPASMEGMAPELKQDPQDGSASVLICNREF